MPPKLRHECGRCGLVAEFERAGRFRDEDYYEVFQELMTAQARVREYARAIRSLTHDLQHAEILIGLREAELALAEAELRAKTVSECPF